MNKYSVNILPRAQKDYRKLDRKMRERISRTILKLENNPVPNQAKHLTGEDMPNYRLRVGDYRILYDIYNEKKSIVILRIGHRRDIYR